jgi:tripartite-type tricarboxylate transporter receptor subunit TctC
MSRHTLQRTALAVVAGVTLAAGTATAVPAAWTPTKNIEFIIPAGTGGGADQMARMIQGIVQKHNLAPVSIVVINKAGGAGAEGFLDVKGSAGNPHKIIITLSNLFTTPLATGVPFNWRDLTPVAMLALDEFVLWVHNDSPYKTAKDYVEAAKKSQLKMAGTGSKQEDQIITVGIEQAIGAKFTYVPFKGGGDVAKQLVGKHVDSTVNNPIEAVAQWRAGNLRPLCVFDGKRIPLKEKVTQTMSWNDIPPCKESGLPIEYLMLRGIFMPAGVPKDAVDYYIGLFNKVRATQDWKDFMAKGAFNTTFMTGKEYADWVAKAEQTHKDLMTKAGFLAK